MTLLSMGFVACSNDYTPEVGPQTNLPESQLQVSDVSVTTTSQTVNIADYIDAEGNETPISIGTVAVKEGAMPANTILKAKVEFSLDEDFTKSIVLDANTIDDANDINVNPTALQKAYYDGITHNPFQKTVYVRTTLYTLTGSEALAQVGAPEYFDTHSVELTPLGGGPALSDSYYIIGNVQGWSNTYEAATSLPFEHGEANVYDDPVFTIVLPAKYNDQNEREDTWFSILPGNDLDAFVGNDWSVLLGNNVGNGCENLEGSLMTRADFGGDCNMMMPATDGATSYQITINVLEGTYSIQPLNEAGAIVPDPILYMTGSNYNWGETWVPLVPACDQGGAEAATGMSWLMVYLDAGEEFKFAPQPSWGGDFGMSAEVTSECGDVFDASSTDNIKMTKSGWYLLKVKNVDGARKVTFMAPNLYLIGNTSPAGWLCEESGLFTVPTERNGQFVSPAFVADATEGDGGVRMCVNLGEGIDWWRSEFIPVGGQISYRGNNGDQERVKGNAGQKAYINFTLGSGIVK